MKRVALLACAVALAAVAAGCGGPTVGDGDLTDDWAMLATAKVPEPAAGSCWTSSANQVRDTTMSEAQLQPCDMDHVIETASVGHFTGEAAAGRKRPTGAALAPAWADCDKAVTEYLGAEWQSGRVVAVLVPPNPWQWDGGARFYRCDVVSVRTELGVLDPRKTTMKGALGPTGDLRLTCGQQVGMTKDSWSDITPAKCEEPHDVEYVGTISSPAADYPTGAGVEAAFSKTCEAKMLAYIGMSRGSWNGQRALNYGYWMTGNKDTWALGNHTARCYALISGKKVNRSLRGAGDVTV